MLGGEVEERQQLGLIAADLSTTERVADPARAIGDVDVLVNNAGAATAPAATLVRTDESWESDLRVGQSRAQHLQPHTRPRWGRAASGS
ncbi:hypothetical protein Airi02_035270 [Actinoallomurus iriomotensis]|uniref:Uncharacterized protein n=1 Tax=Actinoallomurus iriomotensis TaxID=478107 RepID=A0A9W6VUH1_9ACTN|nr:hypothetical protein Airi02_035270 [Actinoallomurus iriomotensis]